MRPLTIPTALTLCLLASSANAARTLDWNTNAFQLGLSGRSNATFAFVCPPSRPSGYVIWGTGYYTDDSPICPAALHAGVIGWDGGPGVLVISPGRTSYKGSLQHGLASRDFGFFRGSYYFQGGHSDVIDHGADDHGTSTAEDPVADVTWNVCAYPNAADGCGDWHFLSNGTVEGISSGRVVWTGKWTRLDHYSYRYDFDYMGKTNHTWVRFTDPNGSGRATELTAYPDASMGAPYRKGQRSAQ